MDHERVRTHCKRAGVPISISESMSMSPQVSVNGDAQVQSQQFAEEEVAMRLGGGENGEQDSGRSSDAAETGAASNRQHTRDSHARENDRHNRFPEKEIDNQPALGNTLPQSCTYETLKLSTFRELEVFLLQVINLTQIQRFSKVCSIFSFNLFYKPN